MTATYDEDLCTFMIISCPVRLRMRNVAEKYCRENQNTHLMPKNLPPPPENRAVYEIM